MDPCVRRVVFKSTFSLKCRNLSEFIHSLLKVYSGDVITSDMSSFFGMQHGIPPHILILLLVLSHASFFLFLKTFVSGLVPTPEFPFPKPMLYQLSNLAWVCINLYHLFRFVWSEIASNINNYSELVLMLSC